MKSDSNEKKVGLDEVNALLKVAKSRVSYREFILKTNMYVDLIKKFREFDPTLANLIESADKVEIDAYNDVIRYLTAKFEN